MKFLLHKKVIVCCMISTVFALQAANQSNVDTISKPLSRIEITLNNDEIRRYKEIFGILFSLKNVAVNSEARQSLKTMLEQASSNVFNFKRVNDGRVLFEVAKTLTTDQEILDWIYERTDLECAKNKTEIVLKQLIDADPLLLKSIEKIGFLEVLKIVLGEFLQNTTYIEQLENNSIAYAQKKLNYSCEQIIRVLILNFLRIINELSMHNEEGLEFLLENTNGLLRNLHEEPKMAKYKPFLNIKFLAEEFLLKSYIDETQGWIECNLLGYILHKNNFASALKNELCFESITRCFNLLKNQQIDFCLKMDWQYVFLMGLYVYLNDRYDLLIKYLDYSFNKLEIDINYVFDCSNNSSNNRTDSFLSIIIMLTDNYKYREGIVLYLLNKKANLNQQVLNSCKNFKIGGGFVETYEVITPFRQIVRDPKFSVDSLKVIVDEYQDKNFNYNEHYNACESSLLCDMLTNVCFLKKSEDFDSNVSRKILLLKEKGLDINYLDNDSTSVIYMIKTCNDRMLNFLLQNGADLNRYLSNGKNYKYYLTCLSDAFKEFGDRIVSYDELQKYHLWNQELVDPLMRREKFKAIKKIINEYEDIEEFQAKFQNDRSILENDEKTSILKLIDEENEHKRVVKRNEAKKLKQINSSQNFELNRLRQKIAKETEEIEEAETSPIEAKSTLNQAKALPAVSSSEPNVSSVKALPAKPAIQKNALELLKDKKYAEMDVSEKNKVQDYLKNLSGNLRVSLPSSIYNKYGVVVKSIAGLSNVEIDFNHIFSLNIAIKNDEVVFEGGHLYDVCNRLRAFSLVEKTNETVEDGGIVRWRFNLRISGINPEYHLVKTTFPQDWTIEKICNEIVNAEYVSEEEDAKGFKLVLAKTKTMPEIYMKMVFLPPKKGYSLKLITVIPMNSRENFVTLPASPVEAKIMKSVAKAVPLKLPKGATWAA